MTPPPTPAHEPQLQAPSLPQPDLSGEEASVAAWWNGLATSRRKQLTTMTPQAPLPRWAATDLWRAGVNCPLTLIHEQGRLVRRALPPASLTRLLAGPAPETTSQAAMA